MRASLSSCILLVLAALSAGQAGAADDGLHASGGLSWRHDDNLLRVPDGDPGADRQRADAWRQLDGALGFDRLLGRQRISAHAQFSRITFDHFTQLNYQGRDLGASWFWQLGNQFDGRLGASDVLLLAPYTDLRTSARNLRTQRSRFVDGAWRLHPRWRLRAGAGADRYGYELPSQRASSRTEHAAELGLEYGAPSGSTVGLVLRRLDGAYPLRRPLADLGDDFTQHEYRLRIHWLAGGKTTLDVLGGWSARRQAAFGPGQVSGPTGRLSLSASPTAKLALGAAVWRDFAPIESSIVSYTLNTGASSTLAWQASAKIAVDASVQAEQRAYRARRVLHGAGALHDAVRRASLGLSYAPLRGVKLGASVAREARSGSAALGIGAFHATSTALSASMAF